MEIADCIAPDMIGLLNLYRLVKHDAVAINAFVATFLADSAVEALANDPILELKGVELPFDQPEGMITIWP